MNDNEIVKLIEERINPSCANRKEWQPTTPGVMSLLLCYIAQKS